MFASDPKKPIGGNIIAHASTTRYLNTCISFGFSFLLCFAFDAAHRDVKCLY